MSQFLYEYPLPGVTIRESVEVPRVKNPLFSGRDYQVSPAEYALQLPGVGSFYACNGNEVAYTTEGKADPGWVQLYLNGQVLVALLHQRKIINFHASGFIYDNKGIMLLGETGAGKSSITSAFVLNGASFITDDLTVIDFKSHRPFIASLSRQIKLNEESIAQLDIDSNMLRRAEEGTTKYYLNIRNDTEAHHPLDIIIKIETGGTDTPRFYIPDQAERFSILRSEICSWEMLAGMPDTERDYLQQLVQIVRDTRMIRVIRPHNITIKEMYGSIVRHLV